MVSSTDAPAPEGAGASGAPDGLKHPDHVGPYRVLGVLAHGGMGMVYTAEQTEPVRRRVALKVIKAGMDTREVVARFEAERQALAVMDHPSIAKVLDGGATSDGRPYFVMELVKGVSITEYCDTHRLSTRERLRIMVDVCHAVQHAHQKGVIHRDLKPSNVLVTLQDGRPVPKVIDFGIAKALANPLTELTLLTEVGRAVGTPAYMSPEQADPSALDVDTRTDIYSLGVMLYELLVGHLPLDPTEVGLAVYLMRLANREASPSTPSAKFTSLGNAGSTVSMLRRSDPKTLRRELRGDLDWIVMKALDPDRTRRYETVNGLAMDIDRHLNDEPVVARPPSALYRLSRFARRHRLAVAAGTMVTAALVVGLSVAALGLVRARRAESVARREAETSRQVANFLTGLFKVSDPGEARGNTVTAREILDRGADRIGVELAEQPQVQAQMMHTMGVVYRELGLFAQAQPLLERAVATRRARAGDEDADVQASLLELARLEQQQGRLAAAESLYRVTLGARERALGPSHPDLMVPLSALGGMLVSRGRLAEAESLLTRAIALRAASPAREDVDYARTLRHLASSYLAQKRYADAEPAYQRAIAMYERVAGPDHPELGRALNNLGIVYYSLARYGEAERYYRRAEANLSKALGDDHPNVASININLGEIAWRDRRFAEAEERLQRALSILQKRVDPADPRIATTEFDLGNVGRDAGRLGEADVHYRRALQIRETAFGRESPEVAEVLVEYAKLQRQRGRGTEAAQMEARARAAR
ncbi:MAG: serine/threonine-protein kinase [Gemmatimonadota bacterium]|nr:serine/threonine-protein kinase [Gemmatimonadota bacterium]